MKLKKDKNKNKFIITLNQKELNHLFGILRATLNKDYKDFEETKIMRCWACIELIDKFLGYDEKFETDDY